MKRLPLLLLVLALPAWTLTLDGPQKAWVADHKAKGLPLSIATAQGPGIYEPRAVGSPEGLDYRLAAAFARELGLPLKVVVPPDLKGFFTRSGVLPPDLETNTALSYTPDLLKTVDLYAGPFSILPWRERLMTMVPLYPTKNILVGPSASRLQQVADLDGKRLPVVPGSVQESLLGDVGRKYGFAPKLVPVAVDADLLDLLDAGQVDYVLDGGLFFARNSSRLAGKSVSPFPSPITNVGWGVRKDDPVLAGLLSAFIRDLQASGQFEDEFRRAFGTGFQAYLGILGAGGAP